MFKFTLMTFDKASYNASELLDGKVSTHNSTVIVGAESLNEAVERIQLADTQVLEF